MRRSCGPPHRHRTRSLLKKAQALFKPLPKVMDSHANPVTAVKVELGKMLYYEPRLSKSNVISCNSCHNLATYGVDNLPASIGHRWAVGSRQRADDAQLGRRRSLSSGTAARRTSRSRPRVRS